MDSKFMQALKLLHSEEAESVGELTTLWKDAVKEAQSRKKHQQQQQQQHKPLKTPPQQRQAQQPQQQQQRQHKPDPREGMVIRITKKRVLGGKTQYLVERIRGGKKEPLWEDESKLKPTDISRLYRPTKEQEKKDVVILDAVPTTESNGVESEDEDDEDEDDEDDDCQICGDGDCETKNPIVFCDDCNNGFHRKCHVPEITQEVVDDENVPWSCATCVKRAEANKAAGAHDEQQSVLNKPRKKMRSMISAKRKRSDAMRSGESKLGKLRRRLGGKRW